MTKIAWKKWTVINTFEGTITDDITDFKQYCEEHHFSYRHILNNFVNKDKLYCGDYLIFNEPMKPTAKSLEKKQQLFLHYEALIGRKQEEARKMNDLQTYIDNQRPVIMEQLHAIDQEARNG